MTSTIYEPERSSGLRSDWDIFRRKLQEPPVRLSCGNGYCP